MSAADEAVQQRTWLILYRKVLGELREFGTEDHFGDADYLLVDDNLGAPRHTVEIHKLRMLDPSLVRALRSLLQDFEGWEIVVVVDIPGNEDKWPPMGLIIRKKEIIDGLYRGYFPAEFRNVVFEGSRPGTGYD
jgi:hypothetical protein